ncbi:hypothetical protein [Novosphingobium sp. Leaf2]|uniref:hypothetical protein n=1 Tax=Novosphingobium sp. Leaf2 TaxID=1735670 RepID=UPI0006F2CCC7|nr:hypothetical protein [Novosphingobium sp. Leaf2]KQM18408.1 hypothetical protein ASE49_09360 [Novosphingobium sp. Leaf2]
MTHRGSFTTTLMWHDSRGSEIEAVVRVTYVGRPGSPQTMTDPEDPASVEIINIAPADKSISVPQSFYEDEELMGECFDDWRNDEEEAAEWRAQSRRDQLMGGF